MEKIEQDFYNVVEEEEETLTIDFENKTITSKEETILIKETRNEPMHAQEPLAIMAEPLKPSYEQEIQDVFFNKLTSKAIASLLSKHREVDEEVEKVIMSKRMGRLNDILDREVMEVMNKRRQELRNCYAGPIVKYERIPDWAKSYIKEYIENMVHEIDELLMDSI